QLITVLPGQCAQSTARPGMSTRESLWIRSTTHPQERSTMSAGLTDRGSDDFDYSCLVASRRLLLERNLSRQALVARHCLISTVQQPNFRLPQRGTFRSDSPPKY